MNAPVATSAINIDNADVRLAAAELGVTAQLLVNVLSRRGLHLGEPTMLRRLKIGSETLHIAARACRQRAKVHSLDGGIQAKLETLAAYLDLEAGR